MSASGTVPSFVKRLEARIALALSRALDAMAGIAAAAHRSFTFGSVPGPSNTLTFAAPSFTSLTGKVKITAQAYLIANGGTLAAADQVLFEIDRDGTLVAVQYSVAVASAAAATDGTLLVVADVIDTVTAGAGHTWSLHASIGNGHTGGFNGCQILVQDEPVG